MNAPKSGSADSPIELTTSNLGDYLRDLGVVPLASPVEISTLAGGVSNTVLLARWPQGSVVVKQSLPKLRVAVEWEFDRSRVFGEERCMETLSQILPGAAPSIVFTDPVNFAFGMTEAKAGGSVWKEALMSGRIDSDAVTMAAELLASLQAMTFEMPELSERFADDGPLIQGRIDPFHRFVAQRHPDLAEPISAEIDRLRATRSVLVHGDYSPKNLIIYPEQILILDFEVAHWGDPAFDPAFMLTHFILKAVRLKKFRNLLLEESERFWDTFVQNAGRVPVDEGAVVMEIGCLLLARVDGKSPAEYLNDSDDKTLVRGIARWILLSGGRKQVRLLFAHLRVTLGSSPFKLTK